MKENIEAFCNSDPFQELKRWADPRYFVKWKGMINRLLTRFLDEPKLTRSDRLAALIRTFRDIGGDVDYIHTEEREVLLGMMGKIAVAADVTDASGRDLLIWVETHRPW